MDNDVPLESNAAPTPSSAVMDVVPPPPASDPMPVENPEVPKESSEPDQKEDIPKPEVTKSTAVKVESDSPKSGVGIAIFATVVIVIVLAAMATYAYIKTR